MTRPKATEGKCSACGAQLGDYDTCEDCITDGESRYEYVPTPGFDLHDPKHLEERFG